MNDFKKRLSETNSKTNEVVQTIMEFYNGERTEEVKKKILEVDETMIPDQMFYVLFFMAKEYIEKGKVDEQTFEQCMAFKKKEVELDQVPEKWRKSPER